MRATTKALIRYYVDHLDLRGDVLEIGGHRRVKCAIDLFPAPRFRYHDLNITQLDIPNTIIADITDCRHQVADESFDVVLSSDVFEHIDRPWLAAAEITRILRPGGIAITHTLWAWRNHPCPIDYWRFSPECLEFLFSGLTCVEKGYDLSQRRMDQPGVWANGGDSVPIDELGGWREHWSVYLVARKGERPPIRPFRDSSHPLAVELRKATQGTVTNPTVLGRSPGGPRSSTPSSMAAIEHRLVVAENAVGSRLFGAKWRGPRLTPGAASLAKRLRDGRRRVRATHSEARSR